MKSNYEDRLGRWTEISTGQLSNANNILLTLATGSLAYIFDKKTFSSIYLDLSAELDQKIFFYVTALFFMVISISLGVAVLFSRLYDFRISRHLILTRKRIFDELDGKTFKRPVEIEINTCHRLKVFFIIIFCRLPFLTKADINNFNENRQIKRDIDTLIFYSDVLGTATWRWTKIQVFSFLIAIICYSIHLII